MGIGNRTGRAAVLAAAVLLSLAGVTRAGGEAGGDITFRLILRGEVVEGDGFTLAVNAIDNPTIISPGHLCGPDAFDPDPCEAGSYEFVVTSQDSLPVGTELEYVWAHVNPEGEDTVIYTDTVTVMEHDQIFTVTYDYGGASESGGGVLLPDTATRATVEAQPFGVGLLPVGIAAVIGSVVIGVLLATSVVRRPAERCPMQRSESVRRAAKPRWAKEPTA